MVNMLISALQAMWAACPGLVIASHWFSCGDIALDVTVGFVVLLFSGVFYVIKSIGSY